MPLPALLGAIGAGAGGAGAAGAGGAGGLGSMLSSIGSKASGKQGTALLAGKGALNMIQGKMALKKADAAMPGREDPEERAALNYTKRQRRAFQTGTAMKASRDATAAMMKTGMEKSISAGGGTRGLNMMQQMFNRSMLGVAQAGQDKALQYNQMAQSQLKGITDRKLQLGMLKYSELQKRAAEKLKAGKEATNLALARAVGTGETDASTTPSGGSATGDTNPAAEAVQTTV